MAKVMLVEDDNNLREIYEARLQAEGYTIVSAKDGEEALVVAKQEKPDLIISDVMMPKISGFEMLDILRNTDGLKDTKVIMLTALGQSEDQQRADRLGADRYLVKSQVTLEDIVKVSHDLLQDGGEAATAAPAATPPAAAAETTPPASVQAAPAAASPTPAAAPTTSQEDAAVESQIESFVQGATTTAPAPAAADGPVASPEPDLSPPSASDSQTPITGVAGEPNPAADAVASDDKLMDSAVKALSVDPPSDEPAAAPAASTASLKAEPAAADEPANDNVTVAHKKIIKPLETEPKQDIVALAEMEDAKAAAAQPKVAKVITSDQPAAAAPTTDTPSGGVTPAPPAAPGSANPSDDPNAIAL